MNVVDKVMYGYVYPQLNIKPISNIDHEKNILYEYFVNKDPMIENRALEIVNRNSFWA